MISEFEFKVIQTAQKLQADLANNLDHRAAVVPTNAVQPATTCIASAEQPASSSFEQLSKKLKREHATANCNAVQPVSRKRASDQRVKRKSCTHCPQHDRRSPALIEAKALVVVRYGCAPWRRTFVFLDASTN